MRLTPMEEELRFDREPEVPRAGRLETLRRRRPERPVPTTWQGALRQGLQRLVVLLWGATIAALAIDKFVFPASDPGLGFYLVGGTILTGALASANGAGGHRGSTFASGREHERRVSAAFAYVLVGTLVLVVGALVESFAPSWQV